MRHYWEISVACARVGWCYDVRTASAGMCIIEIKEYFGTGKRWVQLLCEVACIPPSHSTQAVRNSLHTASAANTTATVDKLIL